MNSHITLKELFGLVPEKTVGRAPSVKKIRAAGIPVAVSRTEMPFVTPTVSSVILRFPALLFFRFASAKGIHMIPTKRKISKNFPNAKCWNLNGT